MKKNIATKPASGGPLAYHLKITLDEILPPIWRRVVVPGDIRLSQLHRVIQGAMGWTDSHLHDFLIDKKRYSQPDPEFDSGHVFPEAKYRLSEVLGKEGATFFYEYDPGDSWGHSIEIEKIEPIPKGRLWPVCIDGARACPPEDCGGVGGYEELVAAMKNPGDERRGEFIEWLGQAYDPEGFSVAGANVELNDLRF